MSRNNAQLSIVVAAQGEPEPTERCLASLERQNCSPTDLEIIVVEGPPYAACQSLGARHPGVTFIKNDSSSVPLLHGRGVASTSAELVAITESHCTFPPDWASAAMKAARQSGTASVIGGAVEPGSELDPLNKGLFVCDYAQFVPPFDRHENSDLPGNNIVFRRDCLDFNRDFATNGFWKTFYCHELESHRQQLLAEPEMLVFYNRNLTFEQIMVRRWHHGRCFGGMRASTFSLLKRILMFVATPILPFLLFAKLQKRCGANPQTKLMLSESMGSATFCVFAWACGETFGNLFGPGESCDRL